MVSVSEWQAFHSNKGRLMPLDTMPSEKSAYVELSSRGAKTKWGIVNPDEPILYVMRKSEMVKMGMKIRLYFAHAVTDYGTPWEAEALAAIAKQYPGPIFEIVNPNGPDHDLWYKENGMAYFTDLCNTCDGIIWSSFPNGQVGAGVAKEIQTFTDRGIEWIHNLTRDFKTLKKMPDAADILSVSGTRLMIQLLRAPGVTSVGRIYENGYAEWVENNG